MKIIALLFVIASSNLLFAQNRDLTQEILSQKRVKTNKIIPEETKSTVLIPSNFSSQSILNNERLNDLAILKIYYIYTSYHQSASFNQKALDEKRLKRLNKELPGVLSNPYINWEIVEQTGCSSPEEGDDYFHGFVVIHQPRSTEEERSNEIKELEAFLKNPNGEYIDEQLDPLEEQLNPTDESIDVTSSNKADRKAEFKKGTYALHTYFKENISPTGDIALQRDDKWVKAKIEITDDGQVSDVQFNGTYKKYIEDEVRSALLNMPLWNPEIKNGDSVNSTVNLEIRVSYSRSVNGLYTRDGAKPKFNESDIEAQEDLEVLSEEDQQKMKLLEASPLYMNLNLLDKVEKVAIVMDVTASMSSNLAGLNWWIYNNEDTLRIPSYTFFNDGDGMKDGKKRVGQIGGIYQTIYTGEVAPTIIEAMYAGNGGDSKENDLEATIIALQSTPTADAVILIGDNHSDVRDMSLLKGIHKKVHVMLCGKPKAVRIDYLEIAKATGGDVFVNGRRISLTDVEVGAQIYIGKTTYVFTSKGFEIDTKK